MGDDPTDPEQVVRDAFAYVNGDSSKIDAIAESVDVYDPVLPEGEVHNRSEWAAFVRDYREGFPDIHFSIDELVTNDDIVMAEMTISGTHKGEFRGIPPTGREFEIRAIDKFIVKDEQVVEWRPYFDTREVHEQLGLTFPAVLGQLPKLAWRKIKIRASI